MRKTGLAAREHRTWKEGQAGAKARQQSPRAAQDGRNGEKRRACERAPLSEERLRERAEGLCRGTLAACGQARVRSGRVESGQLRDGGSELRSAQWGGAEFLRLPTGALYGQQGIWGASLCASQRRSHARGYVCPRHLSTYCICGRGSPQARVRLRAWPAPCPIWMTIDCLPPARDLRERRPWTAARRRMPSPATNDFPRRMRART